MVRRSCLSDSEDFDSACINIQRSPCGDVYVFRPSDGSIDLVPYKVPEGTKRQIIKIRSGYIPREGPIYSPVKFILTGNVKNISISHNTPQSDLNEFNGKSTKLKNIKRNQPIRVINRQHPTHTIIGEASRSESTQPLSDQRNIDHRRYISLRHDLRSMCSDSDFSNNKCTQYGNIIN